MLNRFFFALLAVILPSTNVLASDAGFLERIDRAVEQRMLSQRIAKSYSQLGLNLQPIVAKQELDDAILRFDDNLSYLEADAAEGTKTSLAALRRHWLGFRTAARGVPHLTGAIWLAHQADEVQRAAERVVRDLQNSRPNAALATGRLVAQAGRQRMLSQRIVKTYLLLSWGDSSELTREELEASVNEFSGALNSLRRRAENTAETTRELDEMAQHWEWLQAALATDGATSYRLIVAEAGEAILQSAERLTKLYARAH